MKANHNKKVNHDKEQRQPQQKIKSTTIIINKGNHNDNKRQLQQKMKGNCNK